MPRKSEGLARAIGEIHKKYTWLINIRNNWKGHLWQGRFLSYPMDERHLYQAVRYIERNPVRAGITKKAEEYPWSSAKAHVFRLPDKILTDFYLSSEIRDWRGYLDEGEKEEELKTFRKHETTGRPLGDQDFITKIEQLTGRPLRIRRAGRPRKIKR